VNPRGGGVVFVGLDELMRGVPLAGQSQFNRLEQFIFRRAHGMMLPQSGVSEKIFEFQDETCFNYLVT
jgi:hypothetical protein